VSGSRPKRGLADFLSQELKAPPAAEPEVRKPVTTEVRKAVTPEVEPVTTAEVRKAVTPEVKVASTTEVRKAVTPEVEPVTTAEVRKAVTPEVEPSVMTHGVQKSVTSEVREMETPAVSRPEAEPTESRTARVTKSRTTEVREGGASEDSSEPLYLRLTRKDVRFRDEQLGALHALARRLSKARRGVKGERITDNTLVRVAVDLLLQHGDELVGGDEAALLESLRKLCRKRG
jgi:hypothetical protein